MIGGWAAVLAVAALAAWAWSRWFEWSRLYHPKSRLAASPDARGLSYEEIAFMSEDAVTLNGWWIPATGARATLLYCHGNADNIADLLDIAEDVHAWGINLFLWDYRGYGKSRWIPTEQGTYRDARAAYEVVRERHGDVERPPVWVLGKSLGGAVATQLAVERQVRGLILESTFTSTLDVGRRWFPRLPVGWMCRYRYDSGRKIGRVGAPVLIAHSPEDEVIPYDMGQTLFEAAKPPKRWVDLSGMHGEAGWRLTPAYGAAIREMIGVGDGHA